MNAKPKHTKPIWIHQKQNQNMKNKKWMHPDENCCGNWTHIGTPRWALWAKNWNPEHPNGDPKLWFQWERKETASPDVRPPRRTYNMGYLPKILIPMQVIPSWVLTNSRHNAESLSFLFFFSFFSKNYLVLKNSINLLKKYKKGKYRFVRNMGIGIVLGFGIVCMVGTTW